MNLTTEQARVKYVPTVISQAEIRRAVAAAGFEALETGGEAEDAEGKARQAEIDQQRSFIIHRPDLHRSAVYPVNGRGL